MVRSVKPSVSLRDWRVSCVLCFINTEDTGLNIVFVRRTNTEDKDVTIPRTNDALIMPVGKQREAMPFTT